MTKTASVLLGIALSVACGSSHQRARDGAPQRAMFTPEAWLKAEAFQSETGIFSASAATPRWGFASCTPHFARCGAPSIPGPPLAVVEGTTLTIHLINGLTGPFAQPVSVMIPGQLTTANPVWIERTRGTISSTGAREAAFTPEAPPDGTTVVSYSWANVKAGTYLYQSGTHPAVPQQRGLFGAVSVFPRHP